MDEPDTLLSDPSLSAKIKTFPRHDLATTEIPFQLFAQGLAGEMNILPSEASSCSGLEDASLAHMSSQSVGLSLTKTYTPPLHSVRRQYIDTALAAQATKKSLYISHRISTNSHHHRQKSRSPTRSEDSANNIPLSKVSQQLFAFGLDVSQPQRTLELTRNSNGEVTGYTEVGSRTGGFSSSNCNSSSFMRAPGKLKDFVRGGNSAVPFRPGGLDDVGSEEKETSVKAGSCTQDAEGLFPFDDINSVSTDSLFSIAPGMSRGIQCPLLRPSPSSSSPSSSSSSLSSPQLGTVDATTVSVNATTVTDSVETEASPVDAAVNVDMDAYHPGSNPRGLLYQHSELTDMERAVIISEREEQRDREHRRMKLIDRDGSLQRRREMRGKVSKGKGGKLSLDDVFDEMGALFDSEVEDDGSDTEEEKRAALAAAARDGSTMLYDSDSDSIGLCAGDDDTADGLDFLLKSDQDGEAVTRTEVTLPVPPSGRALMREEEEKEKQKSWAVMERMSTADFYQQVPLMAIQYPFELDVFQKEAVMHLERGESVFVAAHTSAGKTVVAEYAIALAAKHLTRAIYTSPIKTLSNQKFREFRKTFGEDDVGIMTGDVSINPEASCLILTTEILRSMLYKGADLIRDIEWVIFDEVHYLNDPDRGVVWEEVIIMLPAHINIILLSATVPNTREFADWVGRTKKQKIYVISTHKRPVPLQHFLWCKNKLWKVLDQNKRFLTSGFKDARMDGEKQYNTVSHKQGQMLAAGGGGGGRGGRGGKRGGRRGGRAGGGFRNFRSGRGGRGGGRGGQQQRNKNQWFAITNYLKTRELLPVAVFAFSKKRCEEAATSMIAMDLTTTQEKSEIHTFFDAAVSRLKGSDRRLPQVLRMKELLKRGVGVHHAGMLPILKEVVEMVFSRGLVKILFATETFAMGVNMPTRTVVFESTRKHDGVEFRDLLPGEYTQMAGRAGRRGLDSFGVVVIIARNDVVPEELGVRQMLLGKATRLESRFRLTYNMILSLFRQEDMKVEDMIKRSFSEFWQTKDAPEKKELLRKGAKKLAFIEKKSIDCVYHDDRAVEDYHDLASRLRDINTELAKEMMTSKKYTGKFLPPGRILLVSKNDIASTLAVVLKSGDPTAQLKANVDGHGGVSDRNLLTVLLLLPHSYSLPKRVQERMDRGEVSGVKMGDRYMITVLRPRDIHHVVDIKITVDPTGILIDGYQRKIQPTVQELENLVASYGHAQTQVEVSSSSSPLSTIDLYAHELPILDLAKSMSISNIELADELAIKDSISEALYNSEVHRCPNLSRHMKVMNKQAQLKYRVAQLKYALSDENVTLFADFNQRLTVLQELQYVDTDRTVHLKGRVACEINTCDSLILTELIFENALVDLEPAEIVALLSTMIFHGKSQAEPVLTDRLQDALESLKKVAMSLGNLQLKCGLDIVPSEYVRDNVNIAMVQVVYEWAKGKPFNEICELTDVLEGSIVRCITRLDEACRDVRNAARVVGDSKLYQVMTTASEIIKRDIVFAASLYVA